LEEKVNTKDFLVLLSTFLVQLWFRFYLASDSSAVQADYIFPIMQLNLLFHKMKVNL